MTEYAYAIRTCSADMKSHGGFQWPTSGMVKAPDWSPKPICGYGLHGLLDGIGNYGLLSTDPNAKWLVTKVKRADCVVIDSEKVKFPECEVVYAGGMAQALTMISREWVRIALADKNGAITSADKQHAATTGYGSNSATTGEYANSATTGYGSNSATTGYGSNSATTGNRSNSATTGNRSNSATTGEYANSATTGYGSNSATTGYGSNSATTGNRSNSATTGNRSNSATTGEYANSATTGYGSNSATTGYGSNSATTGNRSNSATTGEYANSATTGYGSNSATTGYGSNSAAVGEGGIAAALGTDSLVAAGENGIIVGVYLTRSEKKRGVVGHVGEDSIEAKTWYRVNNRGKFIKVGPVEFTADGQVIQPQSWKRII